eukprot:CAMPEP_0113896998 /NCGR_PEP_ID=MMETSP0780_2-20120614/18384_1 /TAXON_ID=652834 /ORGANISM="Palpitomonas bilix" /LENGTH=484 /DNA_ID=CAMNT_0000888311 /DNA_START=47 /DNA_END=1501 /DNA_ORIENTATION=- /assembly_acc=CAM_ASM_000599
MGCESDSQGPALHSGSPAAVKDAKKPAKVLTKKDIERMTNENEIVFVINKKAYRVTNWVKYHPGGPETISNYAGKDATAVFNVFHPEEVAEKKLKNFYIGDVTDAEVDNYTKEFLDLHQEVKKAGMYNTSVFYYIIKFVWVYSLWALSAYLVLGRESYAEHMLGAFVMAWFLQQVAFLGHDSGHNGVSHYRDIDKTIGLFVGPFSSGISIAWWKSNHNTHHVVTNSVDHDPDIQHLPVFCVNHRLFKSLYSYYYKRVMDFDAAAKLLIRVQHYLFYPIMSVARFNLYFQSLNMLFTRDYVERRWAEIVAMFSYFTWFTVLAMQLPTWGETVSFILISHMVAGILHVQICCSHFSMDTFQGPLLREQIDSGKDLDFFRHQLATSLNIDSNWMTHWFHGGLQFQIEHHLFPRLPRHSLKYVKPMVMKFCKRHNVDYYSISFLRANQEIFRTLKKTAGKVGKEINEKDEIQQELKNGHLYHGFHAIG